ncbi:MAG TPA: hypothetical protein VM305_08330 [Candidatus Limnocylindrales bacterium]|nr:hypothetical protein [Candidatus Limnocylindrales bacterium]
MARRPLLYWPDGEPLYAEDLPSLRDIAGGVALVLVLAALLWLLLVLA